MKPVWAKGETFFKSCTKAGSSSTLQFNNPGLSMGV